MAAGCLEVVTGLLTESGVYRYLVFARILALAGYVKDPGGCSIVLRLLQFKRYGCCQTQLVNKSLDVLHLRADRCTPADDVLRPVR